MWAQYLRGGRRVMRAEVPGQRLGQLRDLRRSFPASPEIECR